MVNKRGKLQPERQDRHKREMADDSFERLLEESFKPVRALEIGNEIEARVIGFDNDHVFLDLGSRVDGMLRKAELMRNGKLRVSEGDKVKVFITGKIVGAWQCSCKFGTSESEAQDPNRVAAIMALEEAFNANTPVEGRIMEVTRGGFKVNVMGVDTFCPLSQIDRTYCGTPDEHLNKVYTFVIIQFEDDGAKIVLSRREFLGHEAKKLAQKLWKSVEIGEVHDGVVKSIQDFGAFVDIGGIEGLLHISEITYERVASTADVLQVGQKLRVAIKDIDRERHKLSLSMKSLMENPWTAAISKLKVGAEYQGKVVRMKTFGVFVELFPGVDGMVHISRLGTDRRHQHPKEVVNIGDMVTVRVLEIDETNHRISLTMEQEEVDFSQDLENIKKQQEEAVKGVSSKMSEMVDSAVKKDS